MHFDVQIGLIEELEDLSFVVEGAVIDRR